MNWYPAAGPTVLALRAQMLSRARDFFAERSVLEVQTPVLVSTSCPDPAIPSIVAIPRVGGRKFLHTSPEHAMKRLMCAGSGDIYQICPVFRDGEAGQRHNPEFTMIEWYRMGLDQQAMARETVEFVAALLEREVEPVMLSYADAFRRALDVDPHVATLEQLKAACESAGVPVPPTDDRDVLLDLMLAMLVQPGFDPDTCYILYDYPASQAALARIRADNPAVAERFEIFYGGLELANGFHELSDPQEQRQRFTNEQRNHEETGITPPPLDQHLLAALEHGLPDCAGVALGFDRLVMLACGSDDISTVMAFPADRA